MTEEELAQIEARAKAATPGPWNVSYDAAIMSVDEWYVTEACRGIPGHPKWVNAVFIASAREDIPALIAALREAWKERDTALADLALSRFENGQMQKALVDVCVERDAAIARAEAAEEAYKEALGEERVANSRADMNARFRLAAEAERDAAYLAGRIAQAEEDARIAQDRASGYRAYRDHWPHADALEEFAAAIRANAEKLKEQGE